MCYIIVDLALCDSVCSNSDLPDGCLKIYPYTHFESVCEEADCVLGFCGNVEMQKREDKEGSPVEKRICESCVAWSALMRDRAGRGRRRSFRRAYSSQSDSGSEYSVAIMTPSPSHSEESSEFEVEVEGTASGD